MPNKPSNLGSNENPMLWPINLATKGIKSTISKIFNWGKNETTKLGSKVIGKIQNGVKSSIMGIAKGIIKNIRIPVRTP